MVDPRLSFNSKSDLVLKQVRDHWSIPFPQDVTGLNVRVASSPCEQHFILRTCPLSSVPEHNWLQPKYILPPPS